MYVDSCACYRKDIYAIREFNWFLTGSRDFIFWVAFHGTIKWHFRCINHNIAEVCLCEITKPCNFTSILFDDSGTRFSPEHRSFSEPWPVWTFRRRLGISGDEISSQVPWSVGAKTTFGASSVLVAFCFGKDDQSCVLLKIKAYVWRHFAFFSTLS